MKNLRTFSVSTRFLFRDAEVSSGTGEDPDRVKEVRQRFLAHKANRSQYESLADVTPSQQLEAANMQLQQAQETYERKVARIEGNYAAAVTTIQSADNRKEIFKRIVLENADKFPFNAEKAILLDRVGEDSPDIDYERLQEVTMPQYLAIQALVDQKIEEKISALNQARQQAIAEEETQLQSARDAVTQAEEEVRRWEKEADRLRKQLTGELKEIAEQVVSHAHMAHQAALREAEDNLKQAQESLADMQAYWAEAQADYTTRVRDINTHYDALVRAASSPESRTEVLTEILRDTEKYPEADYPELQGFRTENFIDNYPNLFRAGVFGRGLENIAPLIEAEIQKQLAALESQRDAELQEAEAVYAQAKQFVEANMPRREKKVEDAQATLTEAQAREEELDGRKERKKERRKIADKAADELGLSE